jgi:integrase
MEPLREPCTRGAPSRIVSRQMPARARAVFSHVFASAAGTRQDGGRVRGRVLAKAAKRANAKLAADGQTPLPEGLTLHALRRTCASVLVALGKDPRYVMAQLGHTDPTVTLGIYAQAMTSSDEDRERLRLLVEGANLGEGHAQDRYGSMTPADIEPSTGRRSA